MVYRFQFSGLQNLWPRSVVSQLEQIVHHDALLGHTSERNPQGATGGGFFLHLSTYSPCIYTHFQALSNLAITIFQKTLSPFFFKGKHQQVNRIFSFLLPCSFFAMFGEQQNSKIEYRNAPSNRSRFDTSFATAKVATGLVKNVF